MQPIKTLPGRQASRAPATPERKCDDTGQEVSSRQRSGAGATGPERLSEAFCDQFRHVQGWQNLAVRPSWCLAHAPKRRDAPLWRARRAGRATGVSGPTPVTSQARPLWTASGSRAHEPGGLAVASCPVERLMSYLAYRGLGCSKAVRSRWPMTWHRPECMDRALGSLNLKLTKGLIWALKDASSQTIRQSRR